MPTMTISKKELLKILGSGAKGLSDEKLADRISMLGTDLEGISGDQITVEIFPNRPDLLSQQGFARALASFLGIPGRTGLADYKVKPSGITVTVDKTTEKCRPFTTCAVVRGLKLDDERIKEIVMVQEKLHVTFGRDRKRAAIGIYPLEHVTPPITFRGMKPEEIKFRPLEARSEMTAHQILEEHPKGKDYAHLLKGLARYACFVDAKGEIMSLTPIINSERTGKVSEATKDVFIECSGHDFRVLNQCLNIIVTALADMGGSIESCTLRYGHGTLGTVTTPNLTPGRMRVDLAYVNRMLGLSLDERRLVELLGRMGFGYDTKKREALVPAYRTDILHAVDLIEDIAIAYGYENFTPKIPTRGTVGEESRMTKIARKVREILVGHGLLEMKNYHLTSRELQLQFSDEKELVMLASSVSSGYDTIRTNPLVSLVGALARNRHHEYPQRVFEIGEGISQAGAGRAPTETQYVAVLLADENADYTAARQVADSVCALMGLEVTYAESTTKWLFPGRTAAMNVKRGDKTEPLGFVGEVHPCVLTAAGIDLPCAAVLLRLDAFL